MNLLCGKMDKNNVESTITYEILLRQCQFKLRIPEMPDGHFLCYNERGLTPPTPKKCKGNVCASLPFDDHAVLFCSEDPLTTYDHILHGRCLLTARAPRSRTGQREERRSA